jgi:hypothetical protein
LEAGKHRDKLAAVSTEPVASEPLTLAASSERVERLFVPQSGSRSKLAFGLGMLGCALLGAGVYAALLAQQPVAEASRRIPSRVDISPKAHERLPRLVDAEGVVVPATRLQLAGQKCSASGVSITFESDARLCANCAALYHVQHVPAACLRCERPLAQAAASARATG